MNNKIQIENYSNNIINTINNSLWDLPSPSSISYFWNIGATLGVVYSVQITSGLLLTMHYTSYAEESFNSILLIINETWSGWLIRFIHINGASLFFISIYMHIARSLYFSSYNSKILWNSGVTILLILIAISFMGYVLPWGQISYWAVAVITNLLSVVPVLGNNLVEWVWGGFNVSSPTLIRFYSLHFLIPFILAAAILTHLIILHNNGSNNPIGLPSDADNINFHPYFSTNDLQFILAVFSLSIIVSFFNPYALGDPVNITPANPMQTPIHIQPEWYFLTSYAILRAMPSNVAGILCLAFSVLMFFILPTINSNFSSNFNITSSISYWTFWALFLSLTNLGSIEAEEPMIYVSNLISLAYFSSLIIMAICSENCCFENNYWINSRS